MEKETGDITPVSLAMIQADILKFGRYLLTFVGFPAFIINVTPALAEGNVSLFLWLQVVVFPFAVCAAWILRAAPLRAQALILSLPLLLVSILGLGQWGPSFGAGILQMAILSLLLVFFFSSIRAFLLLSFLVLAADALIAAGIVYGWLPAPDIRFLDSLDPANWQRVFLSSIAAVPITAFILGKVIQSLSQALKESHSRLERVKEEQAAKEEAQHALDRAQRMEIVGRMASGLSHDFNNTLTVIRGTSELIQMDPESEEVPDLAQNIIRSADNAADISRRLLIFSRQGDISDVRPVDLGSVLQRLGKSLRRLLPADIEVNVLADATLPAKADPSQLDQAILNLSLNARDAMPKGGWLELSTEDRTMADGAPGVLLRVRDSGIGMDEETLARATEPFFTTKDEGKGTGLGLAMVKKMVDLQGGTLRIDSSPGLGSCFDIILPAWTEGEVEVTEVAREVRPRGKILVVDDDSSVRRVMEQALEADGHRVVAMESPGQAATLLSGGYHFDLLITDGVPQRENTPPLMEQFLAGCPDGRVLVYSGYTRDYLEERGMELGGRVEMAPKPLPMDELRRLASALITEGTA